MDSKGSLFLKLLVNKFHPTRPEALIPLLPASLQKELHAPRVAGNDFAPLLDSCENFFQNVHYSWFSESLEALPAPLQACIVGSFEKPLQKKLSKPPALEEKSYPEVVRTFLLTYFLKRLQDTPLLPRKLTAPTSLDALLDIKKEDLVELIDLLAMQDLAEEVRHIVDKKLIQAIIADLTPAQQKYLKVCMHQKSKISIPPLHVKEAHKDKKTFLTLLHKRGLKRLAIATSGLPSDFMWYLTHRLDCGRGKILLAQWQKEEVPLSTQVVQMQIQQILPILKGSS